MKAELEKQQGEAEKREETEEFVASVARALIGNVGLMAMFEGVAAATPEKPLAVYTTLRFLKYALVPVYIIHCAPPIFEVLGI